MKLNKVLVVGVVGILLVCLFTFKKDNKQMEEYVLKDRIEVNDSYNSIAMYQVDGGKETKIDKMPESGYVIDTDNSYCMLNGEKDQGAILKTNENGEHIIGNLAPEERCFVKFVKLSDKTLAELDLHSQGTVEDFSKTACIGDCDTQEENGVYETEDDFGTSYYFRGTVSNNWVQFGHTGSSSDDASKIWWRIIRINGDGSIRLIYAGTGATAVGITDSKTNALSEAFNGWYTNNMYVGYEYKSGDMHGYKTGITKSNALSKLEDWFKTNLTDEWDNGNGQIDLNAGFCNDRSGSTDSLGPSGNGWSETMEDSGGTGTTPTFYGYIRLAKTTQPTLKCSTIYTNGDNIMNKNKDYFTYIGAKGMKQNGTDTIITGTQSLTYPVGLVTADEINFAGGVWNKGNTGYWLYTKQYYWTMSPSDFSVHSDAHVFLVNSDGDLEGYTVSYANGLRPVINLKSDTKFKFDHADKPKGTSDNPYIVSN